MGAERGAGTVLLAVVALLSLPASAAHAQPTLPEAKAKPKPTSRCVVIGPPPRAAPPKASPDGETLVVTVPRLRCTGRNPQDPSDGTGNGGGNANGGTTGDGGGIPFTGFDAAAALAASGGLVLIGALLQRLGRRRIAAAA